MLSVSSAAGTGLDELKEFLWKFIEAAKADEAPVEAWQHRGRALGGPRAGRVGGPRPQAPGIGPSRLHALASSLPLPARRPFGAVRVFALHPRTHHALRRRHSQAPPWPRVRRRWSAPSGSAAECWCPTTRPIPTSFRTIAEPPAALFLLGRAELLGPPAVAVVGSRDHTPYGAEVARSFAWQAAAAGVVVVSGMARGLDAVAHHAALEAGGGSIGVLGNGLGVIYPSANRRLYEAMADRGLLLTEFPPGERPHAGSFPRRNRLISGAGARDGRGRSRPRLGRADYRRCRAGAGARGHGGSRADHEPAVGRHQPPDP